MRALVIVCLTGFLFLAASCGRTISDPDPFITKTPPEIGIGSSIDDVRLVYGTPDREGYEYHDLGQFDDNGLIRFDYSMRYESLDLTFWLDKNWPRLVTHIDGDL
ncbi:MAG: hypothetical protein AAFP70_16905 [Calditrichota bacterium]